MGMVILPALVPVPVDEQQSTPQHHELAGWLKPRQQYSM